MPGTAGHRRLCGRCALYQSLVRTHDTSFFSATLIYSSPLRFGVRGSVDQSVPRPAGFFVLGIGPRPAVPSSAAYMLASTSSSRWPDSNSVRACPLAS